MYCYEIWKKNSTFASIMKIRGLYILIMMLLSMLPGYVMAQNVECEDTCTHVHGIDISHYQGDIFWEAIGENSKMAYVYIKASEGGDRLDDRYEHNIFMAHSHGLKVGAYHFYRPKTDQQLQVDNFFRQFRPTEQDLIPMIDIETTGGLSNEAFLDSLTKFLFIVENTIRQKPLIYTGANFYDRYLCGKLDDYKIMIAQYTQREPVLRDERDITMWQYTGKGHIDGVNGYVDKSRFMGKHSLRELRYRRR